MKRVLPANVRSTLAGASATFQGLLAPALLALPAQVSLRLVQQAEQTRDFARYEAALHAEREISRNDTALQQGFARHLTGLLAKSIATSYAEYRPSIHDVPANAALRLVDTVEVEDSVLLMQIAGEYRKQAGSALQELDVRIANLFGQSAVRERENPFRPYLIAKSIALAVADAPVSRGKVLAVTQHLAMALADQAANIYQQVNEKLRAAGISADLRMQPVQHQAVVHAPTAALAPTPAPVQMPVPVPSINPAHGSAGVFEMTHSGAPRPSALAGARARLQQRLAQWAAQSRQEVPVRAAQEAASMSPVHLAGAMPMLNHFLASAARTRHAMMHPGVPGSRAASAYADGDSRGGSFAGDASSMEMPASPASFSGAESANDVNQESDTRGPGTVPTDLPPARPGSSDLAAFLASPATVAMNDPRLQQEPFPNLIFENRRQLEQHSNATEELITIDVVGMLFDFILLDQRVPAAIRAQIGRLQYYLLQVALAEPALMTESGHPARQLVNRIGTASSGAEDKPEAMTRVTSHVRSMVDVLLADAVYRPEVLDTQLSHFEQFMRELVLTQHIGNQRDTQELIASLESTSQKALRREQLRGALAIVLDQLHLTGFVSAFIVDDWVNVIVDAGTPQDAVRWRELVPTLVWSVLPKSSSALRQQLLSTLGPLVRDLKAGFQANGATGDIEPFLKRLMRTHRTLVGQGGEDDASPSLNAVRSTFDYVLRMHFVPTPLVAAPLLDYLSDIGTTGAGIVEVRRADASLPDDPATVAAEAAPGTQSGAGQAREPDRGTPGVLGASASLAIDADPDLVRNRLCIGAEVEIDLDGEIQRGMLVWADSKVKNMLLSFSNGRRPVAVSVRLFRVLLGKGRARFLEADPLFDRAVFAVLDEAQAEPQLNQVGSAS